jgi:DHA1 family bicyclomycin/chloramphenicol resistance-like MFS transporter
VPWSVLPIMIYTGGMAFAMPSLTLLALEIFPRHRGSVSSLQSFVQSFISSVSAGVLSPLLSSAALMLAFGMTALLALGAASWMVYLRITRRIAAHA